MQAALRIIVLSVRQVVFNLNAVVRIFLVPVVLTILAMDRLQLYCLFSRSAIADAVEGGYFPWRDTAAFLLVVELLFLRCAVCWHRFVLLSEPAPFPLYRIGWGRILAYLRRTIWVGFLVALISSSCFLAAFFAVYAMTGQFDPADDRFFVPFQLVFAIPLYAISLRLGCSLPGAALGNSTTVRQTWTATSSHFVTFCIVGLCITGLAFGADQMMTAAGVATETPTGGAIRVTVGALRTILTLSILTTLYGYYVDKRPLT